MATRRLLLGSVAPLALLATPALAQDDTSPSGDWLSAQAGSDISVSTSSMAESQSRVSSIAPDPQIVIADPGDSTSSLDPVDVNGVGQMIVDQQNGFIGLCTATLINPRTVIFAAHCVNDEPGSAYGSASGGKPIGFGFSNDNYAGLLNWYFGGNQTDTSAAFYNGNWVTYNPASLEPEAASFLYGDVAMASLDTPAADVPTWALMFSPLPDPGAIGDDGTGYHVTITGYGRNGSASSGSAYGVDFRRRSAENMLGALASLDQFENFLFGSNSTTYPQNLYWIDFDDPTRTSPYDFNAWRDEGLENEGITASGDSGGPLILDDTYDISVVIGVLSGGYTRFFNGQPANGYGTASFYQPLYLYWDWIAANNPYHYASAKAGDGAWEDPEHWVTTLDPNYMVLDDDGNLVNGVPTTAGEGSTGNSGTFGQACFQLGGSDECLDMATGEFLVDGQPTGGTAGSASDASATLSVSDFAAQLAAQAGGSTYALPDPTLENGLPGASDFVPDNSEVAGAKPAYYDVTLTEDGTTTLSSTVTVDRLTISGTGAALDITEDASLTSLMSINQYAGMVRVDGTLATNGDYFLMTGGLQGSGTIAAPYFTSVAGVIAPGGVGTLGTLTFQGNLILASGTSTLIDLASGGLSDHIVVQATGAGDGLASVGGLLVLNPTTMIRDGDSFSILSAEGGISGTFDGWNAISAILTPELTYTATGVDVVIEAGLYADVVDTASPVQFAYARLLDRNRSLYNQYAGVYGPLDMMWEDDIMATLEGLAPREQPLLQSMATAALDTNARFIRDRIATVTAGVEGGTLAYYGNPSGTMAVFDTSNTGVDPSVEGMGATPESVVSGALPDTMTGFVAGGYIDGKSDGTPTATPYAGDKFHGYYLAGGLEISDGDTGFIGMALSYTRMEGEPGYPSRSVDGDMFQVNLYGGTRMESGFGFDFQASGGFWDFDTKREVSIGASEWTLRAKDAPLVINTEVGVSQMLGMGSSFSLTPRLAFRANRIDFTRTAERGGGPALQYEMQDYRSIQGRAGARLAGSGAIKPYLEATYVHDFEDKPGFFTANFVGGLGSGVGFALPGDDQDWGEVGVGITTGGKVAFSLHAETTVWRDDLSYQSYRGAVTVTF
ncbi:autotransporter domain-containing protein [Novosphingobium profundi]|nr:autotransporter domain-containing protein [Novosphingobium profundi]